jgi:t-SNARE complex subunit (syntaxin)
LSGGLIKFKDYGNELMKRRTEEIEQVKRITTEVASLSNDIKFETFNQGEKMNEIEGNIVKMSINVKKAEKETQDTEILTRKNQKGLYFLICVLLFLIFIIVYIISKMIK